MPEKLNDQPVLTAQMAAVIICELVLACAILVAAVAFLVSA
jgi:hypothetical protein